ncbi:MAG: UbiX family flavin prenyltransferase [Prevotellaceae bacterium]|jgi:4-hydroxy-3-polyprenylbenzoate decarboxylase|nr:UbiX family flavin prenyltransferase [Prevotellaceae bacterium]
MEKNIVVAVTGASGALYAKLLLERLCGLRGQVGEVAVVLSGSGRDVFRHELGRSADELLATLPVKVYDNASFSAPFASGSSNFGSMVVAPCSMGTLARIAAGVADSLISRAADVMLKERRRLVLLVREAPYNLIHLRNMAAAAEAGAIICPASPSFYSHPQTIDDLAMTVVNRAVSLAGVEVEAFRWGEEPRRGVEGAG